ncbi:U-box domain-containing protein 9-like [Musa acuminata AAA Group]|uniref:U-box domain-containing protein 9-like n=1 Tax=Musa acuminata AAA Group TaxID=214697 RepID=UPI0031D17586
MALPFLNGVVGTAAMAKPGVSAAAAGELKNELQRLVREIAEEDDGQIGTYEEAARVLAALKQVTFAGRGVSNGTPRSPLANQRRTDERMDSASVPEHFRCPISSELMKDPVVLASGQTYDRPFIQEWLNSGNRTCPQSHQILPNTILTPNHLVHRMISQWCIEHDVSLPPLDNEQDEDKGLITVTEKNVLDGLLQKICSPSSVMEQKRALSELRLLTKCKRSFRALIGENDDAISQLLAVPSIPELSADPKVQEDTVTTILNISINETNKKIVGDNPQAIPFLIDALKAGRIETCSNSAAALFSLSALDSNKLKIGELGAMKPLIELLEQGSSSAKKDAGSAIFSLCLVHENRARAVSGGVLGVVLKAITDRSLVNESLAILALLSSNQEAIEEIAETGGVPCLLSIIRESSCARNKENAVAVLYSICMYDRKRLREVGEEEDSNGIISQLVQNGTSRARRKAAGILDKWKRTLRLHYSC